MGFLGRVLLLGLSALAGNWAGDRLRAATTGEPGHQLSLAHTDEAGETTTALNLLMTNLLPAILVGLTAKPRWLWAFIGGTVTSFLLGDRYEESFWQLAGLEGTEER